MKGENQKGFYSQAKSICSVCAELLSRLDESETVCSSCKQLVCNRCPKQKVYDSKLQRKVLICDSCFSSRAENNIRPNFENQLATIFSEQEMLTEKLKKEREKTYNAHLYRQQAQENYEETVEKDRAEELQLLSQVTEIQDSNLQIERETISLQNQIAELQQQNKKCDLQTAELYQEIAELKYIMKKGSPEINEFKTLIHEQRNHNQKIINQISDLSQYREYGNHDFRAHISDLQNKLKDAVRENKYLKTEIMHNNIKKPNLKFCNSPSIIKRLEKILAKQQSEIDHLRKQLTNQPKRTSR